MATSNLRNLVDWAYSGKMFPKFPFSYFFKKMYRLCKGKGNLRSEVPLSKGGREVRSKSALRKEEGFQTWRQIGSGA